MIKNLFVLLVFAFITSAYAKHPVVQESLSDAESFKLQKAEPEKKEGRDIAGDGYKPRHRVQRDLSAPAAAPSESSDSELRYWQYSE